MAPHLTVTELLPGASCFDSFGNHFHAPHSILQAGKDKAVRPSIVITELPYQTNKSDFVATTARLVEEQKLTGEQKMSSWANLTEGGHC